VIKPKQRCHENLSHAETFYDVGMQNTDATTQLLQANDG